MRSPMSKMLQSGVRGVRDGAEALSHTLGDVLDDVKARVDDVVDEARPTNGARRRNGGLLLFVVVLALVVIVRKRMLRSSASDELENVLSDASTVSAAKADLDQLPPASISEPPKDDAGKVAKAAKSEKSSTPGKSPASHAGDHSTH